MNTPRSCGFSLLELLLVLGVLAVLMAAAFVLYQTVQKRRAAHEAATQAVAALTAIRALPGCCSWVNYDNSYQFFPKSWAYLRPGSPPMTILNPPSAKNSRLELVVVGSDVSGTSTPYTSGIPRKRTYLMMEAYALPADPDFCIPFIMGMGPGVNSIKFGTSRTSLDPTSPSEVAAYCNGSATTHLYFTKN